MEIRKSPFSKMTFEPEHNLLLVSWLKDSQQLKESEVKMEIGEILNCLQRHTVQKIIVDSRNYTFRDNDEIQNWINRDFMPRIMDSSVRKYAIVVATPIQSLYDGELEAADDEFTVEYFENMEDAFRWTNS